MDEIFTNIFAPILKVLLKCYLNICTTCGMAHGVAQGASLKPRILSPLEAACASKSMECMAYHVQPYARHV